MARKKAASPEMDRTNSLAFFLVFNRMNPSWDYCQQASGGSRLHCSQEEQKIAKSVKSTLQSPSKSPRMEAVHFCVVKAMLCPPPAAIAIKS